MSLEVGFLFLSQALRKIELGIAYTLIALGVVGLSVAGAEG
jgi:multidrug transporter EmrE-like cation transporter